MKKILLFISLIIVTSVFFACDKTKTAQELLEEENKAIERFIKTNGFEVTKDSAKMLNDTTGKVYFKTEDRLYIHVIDPGNGNKAKYHQEVLVRYRDFMFFKSDTTKYSNEAAYYEPDKFHYGNSYSYTGYACAGWYLGLGLVSENAVVSLIIPSTLQPASWQSSYSPMYCGHLKYRFK